MNDNNIQLKQKLSDFLYKNDIIYGTNLTFLPNNFKNDIQAEIIFRGSKNILYDLIKFDVSEELFNYCKKIMNEINCNMFGRKISDFNNITYINLKKEYLLKHIIG